jgi:hypothetical protein
VVDTLALRHSTRHAIELVLERAARNPEFEAAAAQQVAQSGFAGQAQRVPVGCNDDSSAKPDPAGVCRPVSQQGERIWPDDEFDAVVFCCLGNLEAALFSKLHEVRRVFRYGVHVVARR